MSGDEIRCFVCFFSALKLFRGTVRHKMERGRMDAPEL